MKKIAFIVVATCAGCTALGPVPPQAVVESPLKKSKPNALEPAVVTDPAPETCLPSAQGADHRGTAAQHGWSLDFKSRESKSYLLVGESLGDVRVELTLANRSFERRAYPPLKQKWRNRSLEVVAEMNGKSAPRSSPFPAFGDPPKRGWPILDSGAMVRESFALWQFDYKRLEDPGKLEVKAALETDHGVVASAPFHITVVDIAPRNVRLSRTVPLTERATRTDGTAPRVVVQLVDVGEDRWLIYRRFAGPEYGGGVEVTERLTLAKDVTTFEVSGSFGDDEPLTVTYPHRPGGRTTLEVDSYLGTVRCKSAD